MNFLRKAKLTPVLGFVNPPLRNGFATRILFIVSLDSAIFRCDSLVFVLERNSTAKQVNTSKGACRQRIRKTMINENFIFLGTGISILAMLSYLRDTLRGKTKPNRVTWGFWASVPMLAFFAQLEQGVGLQALTTFMFAFNPLLIFCASFVNKNAYWRLGKLDYICGGIALAGLVLWLLTGEGILAIIFSIGADFVASFPTMRKAFIEPETENANPFLAAILVSFITLLTIQTWTVAYFAFPLYILLNNAILYPLIRFKLGPKLRGSQTRNFRV